MRDDQLNTILLSDERKFLLDIGPQIKALKHFQYWQTPMVRAVANLNESFPKFQKNTRPCCWIVGGTDVLMQPSKALWKMVRVWLRQWA